MKNILLCFSLFIASICHAVDYTWTGNGTDNNWSTSANWSPAGIPGTNASDNVTIGLAATSPKLDQNRTIANLVFSQQTLDLNGFLLTVTGGISSVGPGLIKNGAVAVTNETATISNTTIIQPANVNMIAVGCDLVSTVFQIVVTGAGYNGTIFTVGGIYASLYLAPTFPSSGTTFLNIEVINPLNKFQSKTLELTVNSSGQITNANVVDEGDVFALPSTYGGIYDNATYLNLSSTILSLLFNTCNSTASSETQNFVRTQELRTPCTDPSTVDGLAVESMTQTTEYTDGLGRPLETVIKQYSPQKKDLIHLYEYDQAGRIPKKYLPFVADVCTGTYMNFANAKSQQQGFYTANADPYISKVTDLSQYTGTQNNTYTQLVYDNSSLDRIMESAPPGDPWKLDVDANGVSTGKGHTLRMNYRANSANEVLLWTYDDATGNASAASGGSAVYYAANTLYVVEKMDENWNPTTSTGGKVILFTDIEGHILLKRDRKDASTNLDTYYIYDAFDRVRYIIPPLASGSLGAQTWLITPNSTFTKSLLFSYQYDSRHRVTSKQVPGAGPVTMVYDLLDRPVFVQDGNMSANHQWHFFKYDALGREIMQGVYTDNTNTATTLQTAANTVTIPFENRSSATGSIMGYSNGLGPANINTANVYLVNYFDDYDFDNNGTADYTYANASLGTSEPIPSTCNIGRVTGTLSTLMSSLLTKLTKVHFYDKYSRVIQSQGNNHLYLVGNRGSTTLADITTTVYDWAGKVLATKQVHTPGVTNTMTIQKQYTYDHMGRAQTMTQQNNTDEAVLVSSRSYNELGQEIEKNLHSENSGTTFLQSIDYRRNIRGWFTSINNSSLVNDVGITNDDDNDLFGMTLSYQDNFNGLNTPKYNGNITAFCWLSSNTSLPASATPKAYLYAYDDVNRLISASNATNTGTSWTTGSQYAESMTYDLNGNISGLIRKNSAASTIDNLTLLYTGNQLLSVADAGIPTQGYLDNVNQTTEYVYDANGNMTSNGNSSQSLQYNYLNLPSTITQAGQTLTYSYDANGKKLVKSVTDMAGNPNYAYHYIDGFVYTQQLSSSCTSNCYTFNFVANEEGRVHLVGTILRYEYDLKDHLGNVRATFDKGSTGNAALIQEDHYYPFGMKMDGLSYDNGSGNRYLYNGKELQQELNTYDYGARIYDPTIGVWQTIDPLAEIGGQESFSPYGYVFDNPVKYTDPDGKCPTCFAGALIGGIVGGGIAMVEGKSLQDVGIAALGGAVSGAIVGSGVGLIASAGVGAIGTVAINGAAGYIAGAAESIVTQGANVLAGKQSEIESAKVVKSAIVGAGSNIVAGKVGDIVAEKISKIVTRITAQKIASITSKESRRTIRLEIRKTYPSLGNRQVSKEVNKITNLKKDIISTEGKTFKASTQKAADAAIESATNKGSDKIKDKLNGLNDE